MVHKRTWRRIARALEDANGKILDGEHTKVDLSESFLITVRRTGTLMLGQG